MGMALIFRLIILLILTVIAGFIIWFFKKKGKLKIGLLIATPIFILVVECLFTNEIDSFFFSKSDVKKDLRYANINLTDDFEILENSVSGFPERFQETKLKISETDLSRIISEIKNSSDFKISHKKWVLKEKSWNNDSPRNKVVITNYVWRNKFVREGYFRKEEYVPIFLIATINPNSRILKYERIED